MCKASVQAEVEWPVPSSDGVKEDKCWLQWTSHLLPTPSYLPLDRSVGQSGSGILLRWTFRPATEETKPGHVLLPLHWQIEVCQEPAELVFLQDWRVKNTLEVLRQFKILRQVLSPLMFFYCTYLPLLLLLVFLLPPPPPFYRGRSPPTPPLQPGHITCFLPRDSPPSCRILTSSFTD